MLRRKSRQDSGDLSMFTEGLPLSIGLINFSELLHVELSPFRYDLVRNVALDDIVIKHTDAHVYCNVQFLYHKYLVSSFYRSVCIWTVCFSTRKTMSK